MKIALVGYGKMGKAIEKIALERGHEIISRIDVNMGDHDSIDADSVKGADICIDFTHPDSAIGNIRKISALGKDIVMGTTGWYDHLEDVRTIVKDKGIGFMYASNFSIGMNIFFSIVDKASKIIDKFNAYDISGIEYHHNRKADSPSGTARTIANILKDNIDRKKEILCKECDRQIRPEELHFASLRCGSIPGMHKVIFDSEADTIELTHTARNREGFALGAVLAAEWLNRKKGFFTIHNMMDELLED